MKKMLTVYLPYDTYFNCCITKDNYLVADTNDMALWKEVRVSLPKGKWSIYSNPTGNKIILQDNE